MHWYSGDIASAINQAKSRGAVFVVYCEGNDETSSNVTKIIDNEAVSSRLESSAFVAIKIKSDEEAYTQFAKIYQLVPVPSIFFIKNGIPVKVVAGNVKSVEELVEAIESVKNPESTQQQSSSPQQQSPPPQQTPAPVQSSSTPSDDSEVVCEGGVCYKKSNDSETSQEPSKNETEEEKQEKIKKAMKLIEQKRIERIKEEQRLEKEREIQRRKEGQEVLNLKKWQQDQELKQIKEDQLKERNEAKAARQRVLDQIEQDKKERALRFAMQQGSSNENKPEKTPVTPTTPPAVSSDTARIQFKKPNGESEIVTFDSSMFFKDLHLFVKNDILQGSVKDFTLATAFPRREFTNDDFDKTLQDLSLTPSSTLLIMLMKKSVSFAAIRSSDTSGVLPTQTDGSFFSMITALFFGLMTPVMALFTYLKGFVMRGNQGEAGESASASASEAGKRKRNEDVLTPNDAAKKRNLSVLLNQSQPGTSSSQGSSPTGAIPKSTAYKRQNPSNNIHRLHENSDDEEDKKTYNGNSTQQL